MKYRALLLMALATALAAGNPGVAASRGASENSSQRNWPYYNGNPAGTHYSTLDQINTANVAKLKVAWTYDTGDAFGKGASGSGMEDNPLIVNNRMWIISPKGRLICLNAATGHKLWSYNPSAHPVHTRQRLRGVSYWANKGEERILFTFGHDLISINAQTGKPDEAFGRHGRVDMRKGLGRHVDQISVHNVTPGAVYKNLIIMGSTGRSPGDVRAYDVRTGHIRWTFHTIPHPGEPGYDTWPKDAWKTQNGANVWAGFTIDKARGIVYVPTASGGEGNRDFYGADRIGRNLFADSLIALNANTGKRIWYFQSVHHDLWDRDFPTPPTLVTVKRKGHSIPAVAQATKSGFVFIFNRLTGKSLFPIKERAVPSSNIPGEKAWPTQPFPLAPAPFARQRLTAQMLTTRTSAAHAAVAAEFAKLRSAGQFVPPSLQSTIILPGLDGGAEWGGEAYDPETGLLYINSNAMAWTLKLKPNRKKVAGNGARALPQQLCLLPREEPPRQPTDRSRP